MLPNLIIIGGTKCGTTALHHYLDLHPQVSMSHTKELHFFVDRERRPPTVVARQGGQWHRGVDWYGGQFRAGADVRGEASPSYTNYPAYPDVPERMASVVPGAKLIYLVRDPIERIASHYLQDYATGVESRPIAVSVASRDYDNSYVWQSRYHAQLARYQRYYDRERILVLTQEALLSERAATLARVFRFLEVSDDFTTSGFEQPHHVSSRKRRNNGTGMLVDGLAQDWLAPLPTAVRWRVRRLLTYPLSRPLGSRPSLPDPVRSEVVERLAEDVDRLRPWFQGELPRWSVYPSGGRRVG